MNKKLLIVLVAMLVRPVMAETFKLSSDEQPGLQLTDNLEIFIGRIGDFQFSSPPIKEVSNVPEFVRDVPVHHDDVHKAKPGIILRDHGDAPWIAEFRFLSAGLKTEITPSITWLNYYDVSLNYGHWLMLGAGVHRRNYTNHPGTNKRGEGAALTFWTTGYDRFICGLRTEVHIDNKLIFGAGYREFNAEFITGHDRYNWHDHKKHINFGKISETSVYGGWVIKEKDDMCINLRAGLNFNDFHKKDSFSELNVEMNDVSYFFSLGAYFGF